MPRRPNLEQEPESVNIMPLMNIIMLLIPFLIMSMEFIKIGSIETNMPSYGSTRKTLKESPKKDKSLNLTLSITDKGITVLTRGSMLPKGCSIEALPSKRAVDGPTIAKNGKNHNFKELKSLKKLSIKQLESGPKIIILMGSMSQK